jgi:hypothetical protein
MLTRELQWTFVAYTYGTSIKQLHSWLGYLPSTGFNKRPTLNLVVRICVTIPILTMYIMAYSE